MDLKTVFSKTEKPLAWLGALVTVLSFVFVIRQQFFQPYPKLEIRYAINNAKSIAFVPVPTPNDPSPVKHYLPAGVWIKNTSEYPARNVSIEIYVTNAILKIEVFGGERSYWRNESGRFIQVEKINIGTINPGEVYRLSKEAVVVLEKDFHKRILQGIRFVTKKGEILSLSPKYFDDTDWVVDGDLVVTATAENMPKREYKLQIYVGNLHYFKSKGMVYETVRIGQ